MPACLSMSRRPLLLVPLLLAYTACSAGDDVASDDAADPCAPEAATIASDTGTVLVRGSDAPCTLEFRELVTLRGEAEGAGALPRLPVAAGPGGTWLTGSYDDGRIAVWSASGELVREFGSGEGDGPGEFSGLAGIVVDSVAGVVYAVSESPHLDVYSIAGDYLRQINLPGSPAYAFVLDDGTVVSAVTNSGGEPRLLLVRGDSATRIGPPQRFSFGFPPMTSAGRDGAWTAEAPWYEINHHALPDGRIDFRIRRDDARFPSPPDGAPENASVMLSGFAIDRERGLAWARLYVPDPDAPRTSPSEIAQEGGAPIAPMTPEQRRESRRVQQDAVIEAFTLDGRLVASTTYDYSPDAPTPLTAGVWYRVLDDDLRSIQLLEPVLTGGRN